LKAQRTDAPNDVKPALTPRRWLRVLAASLLTLVAMLALAVGGLWWWAGTDGSLATGLRWASQNQPLQFDGADGSLRAGGHVNKLVWQQDGITVEATDMTLAWQPLALLKRTLQVDRLAAGSVRVDDQRPPNPTPALPPNALSLPIKIALHDFSIGQLNWAGPPAWQASLLSGNYAYNGQQHKLQLNGVQFASGRYQGQATLGSAEPLTLDAMFSGVVDTPVPNSTSTLPLKFEATAKGPLTELAVKGALQVGQAVGSNQATPRKTLTSTPAQATASAQIMPWEAQPVRQADADFSALNLAALWPGAPQTQLTGSASVQPESLSSASPTPTASTTSTTSTSSTTTTATVWLLNTKLTNGIPGPWDKQLLPIEALQADGEWRESAAVVRHLKARIGGGELLASGQWSDADKQDWTLKATLQRINAAALHSQLAALPLDGQATANSVACKQGPAIDFDVKLQAAAAAKKSARPANNPLQLRDAAATGSWLASEKNLSLSSLRIRTDDAELSGSLDAQLPAHGGKANLSLTAPGMDAQLKGELRPATGAGALTVHTKNAAQALLWLQQLPGVPVGVLNATATGHAEAALNWQGGWQNPAVQAHVDVPTLDVSTVQTSKVAVTPTPSIFKFRAVDASITGKLSQAQVAVKGQLQVDGRRYALQLVADGGRIGAANPTSLASLAGSSWQAVVKQFNATVEDPALVSGAWRLNMPNKVALRWDAAAKGKSSALEVGAGEFALAAPTRAEGDFPPARVQWQPINWRGGELTTAGNISGLPMAWAELFAGPQLAGAGLSGNLVFYGTWDAALGDALRVKASLARSSGDITVQGEAADGSKARIAAGVRQASIRVNTGLASSGKTNANANDITLTLRWDSERAGTADGTLISRLTKSPEGGWTWPVDAPLSGQLRAQLPRIGAWSVLAPPGWRLRGTLGADVAISGTRAAPALKGDLQANDLALRSVVDGIEFGHGRLRAQLDSAQGVHLKINEFYLQGVGTLDKKTPGGSLMAQGEAAWVAGKPQVVLNAKLDKLRASVRSDRQVTLSGDLTAKLDDALAQFTGQLVVDQALILLPEESTPQLGDDVVVRRTGKADSTANTRSTDSRSPPSGPDNTASADASPRTLKVAVQIELGQNFRVQGDGLSTRIGGTLALTADSPIGPKGVVFAPRLVGTVNTIGGQYQAYGQRLEVEQGTLRFTGKLDNPSLNILAIRPTNSRADQRVGVQIEGTAMAPIVRLYASPDLPDAEKLSWLVLGHPSASGGAEAALLQQAAIALLSTKNSGSGGTSGGLAAAIGLDELSFRGAASNDNGGTSEGTITLGKRFSRNFYAAYERSVSGALGTLFVFYDLSKRVTVRGQAGEQGALDLIYTLSFDGSR
jgi:translocation and assembly module TamB